MSTIKNAGIIGLGTLTSRVLGLVRDAVIAAYFPKLAIDAFQIAFMIPNSFRRLTAEGAFSVAVTSVFSKTLARGDMTQSRRFVAVITGFGLLLLAMLTLFGMCFADELTWLAGFGFATEENKFELAAHLTRWMFPYVLLVSVTALFMGFLNASGNFLTPSIGPILLNVALITCTVGLVGPYRSLNWNPIYALVPGVLVGGGLQMISQLPAMARAGLLIRPTFDVKHQGLRRVLKLTAPMVFGATAYQAGLFLSSSLASTLGEGAVTYIQFATRLMELPLAVLVMSISTATLPSLSALLGEGRIEEMKRTYCQALRLAFFVATPAMTALVALAEPITTVLYQRGLFTHADVIETSAAVSWMALGICAVALVRQSVPVFYALENTKTPVLMSLVNLVVYGLSAIPLKALFGHRGLSMALSLAAVVQGFGLAGSLRLSLGPIGFGPVFRGWLKMLTAASVSAASAYAVSLLGVWESGGNSPRNIVVLVAAVVCGVSFYGLATHLLGITELSMMARVVFPKLVDEGRTVSK